MHRHLGSHFLRTTRHCCDADPTNLEPWTNKTICGRDWQLKNCCKSTNMMTLRRIRDRARLKRFLAKNLVSVRTMLRLPSRLCGAWHLLVAGFIASIKQHSAVKFGAQKCNFASLRPQAISECWVNTSWTSTSKNSLCVLL